MANDKFKIGRPPTVSPTVSGGVIHAKDGTDLTFAIYALNYGSDNAALNAIDNLTTAFYECGNNLSNN